jgi:DNA gyrase subunit B
MVKEQVSSKSYKAQDIEVLEGLEPVRKRPGMYIGGTDATGLHHLVREILDNSIDEAMNGHATRIQLTLHEDGESVSIEDNGRGIPVDIHPKYKKSALELILTTLHAGGKFSDRNYSSAGGLHGVGSSVVNALSVDLIATIMRDGAVWEQKFSRGHVTTKLQKKDKSSKKGTKIFFRPDPEIFKTTAFSTKTIYEMLQEKAFLNKGLEIVYVDKTKNEACTFKFQDGLKSFLKLYLDTHTLEICGAETFTLERANGIKIEIALCWTDATNEKIFSYVNGIRTNEGGTHEEAFKTGLAKALRNYMTVHNLLPKGMKLTGEDIREGLVAILSVNIPSSVADLQFQGQTKNKLNNPEVTAPVDSLLRSFENILNSKPTVASTIVERILVAVKARAAARLASGAVSRKIGVSHRLNLPGKLSDCSSTQPDKSELLIVEGDSAGGSAKQGRDRKTQAVLPLRGKILNAIAASEDKLSENKEIADLISAIGCGSGKNIKLDKIRYSKVIILTDADADGMHIASLLLAFFCRFMRPIINAGHLYIAISPLYRIRVTVGSKQEDFWIYSDAEKEKKLREFANKSKVQTTRFKGLGEMNPSTLWETTLNPKTRNLLKVKINDESETLELFQNLLGKDSSSRYRMIQENAHMVEVDF